MRCSSRGSIVGEGGRCGRMALEVRGGRVPSKETTARGSHEGDAGRRQHWDHFRHPFEFGGLRSWNSETAKSRN